MSKQTINLGTAPTGVGGDTPRSAFTKTQSNFDELYAADAVNYKRANIVGSVSQSGGVPTGAIIEVGSNSNGEYVKFANGTQICRFLYSGALALDSPLYGAFVSGWISWTFPSGFVSRPNVIVTPRDDTALFGFVSASGNGGIENIRLGQNAASGSFIRSANFVAFGRWF
ncbi:hypothetical protein PseAD21_22540 [Pseudomonas sp. AD21]|uniref:hypothetical protein n=1 Tax=Pseudomonas sp. AD21 TaxID=396378 RepID=UPI000CC51F6B|nr:hypothetical protein [Pseudomonas sp. AD21]PMQ08915.1 hypothetical protein PseAD21_22540 [Pseudomonas sp. AD21]